MASAYELMLVLRGRNYLSNDLRRAGADISRLRSAGQISGARSQLGINAARLAGTRAIAQAEVASITSGTRKLALDKATSAAKQAELTASKNLATVQRGLTENQAAQAANAEKLAEANRAAQILPMQFGGKTLQAAQEKAALVDRQLIAEQAELNYKLALYQEQMSKVALTEQQLIETEAAHAQRLAVLTDRINTTNAALELNDIKLAENAVAMQRLPLEQLAARARYVEHLGRAFQTLGLIATAALGFAAHAAAKFNTEITLAATQSTLATNNTVEQVQKNASVLQAAIQRMLTAGQTPFKPQDLSQSLYTIFSGLSLQGNQAQQLKEGTQILREFNKVAVANYGQVQLNDVTKLGIALINNFKLSVSQLPAVLNRAQASVRFGAMTFNDLTSSLNQVIPAFKAAGYSADQMFADVAFLSRVFPSLRLGTTGLSRLTETFAKYHDEISKNIGINIAPGGHLSPVAQIVQEIIKAHPALVKGGVDLQNWFKSVTGASQFVNARRVFQAYVTRIALYHDVAGKVLHDNNELTKSFTDLSQTPQVRWAEFTNQLRGLVLEIGAAALPIFQKFAGPIKDAVHWFDTLSPSTKKLVGEIAVFVSVGALLGGTLLVVVGAATRLYATLRLLGIARDVKLAGGIEGLAAKAGEAKGALVGLEGEAGAVSVAMATRFGMVGAIAGLVLYHKQVGQVVHDLGGFQNVLLLVSAAMAALTFGRAIGALAVLAGRLGAADGAAIALRSTLLSLAGLVVSTVVIVHYRRQIENAAKRALSGSGVPGFDETMGLQGYDAQGNPIVNLNKGALGSIERNLGQDATKGVGGFLSRLTGSGVYGRQQREAREIIESMRKAGTLRPGTVITMDMIKQWEFAQSKQGKELKDANDQFRKSGLQYLTTLPKFAKVVTEAHKTVVKGATVTPPPFDFMAAIKRVNELKAAAEKHPSLATWKAYEDALAALQKKATGSQLAAINDMLNQQDKATSKSLSKQKKAAADYAKQLQDITNNVMSMYDQLLQQNQSVMGSLFSGPFIQSPQVQNRLQFGGRLTGADYLKDIHSQVNQFKTFYAEIGRLQRRGAPQELIQQLIQAGPSALPAIKALAGMGRGQWADYIKVFDEGQKLLHQQTIKQLKDQLKDYRKYGNNIALQIISGMRDKRLGLANEIKSLVEQMFGIKVPLTHHAKTVKDLSNAVKAAKTTMGAATAHTYKGSDTKTTKPIIGTHSRHPSSVTYNYNVTAPTSEHASVKTQLRHVEFVNKNKYMVHQ